MERITEIVDERRKFLDLLRIRILMRTIHKRKLSPIEIRSNRLICCKHEIFDNLRCHIAVIRADIDWIPLRIQNHFRLREIEVNRAPLHALFSQNAS